MQKRKDNRIAEIRTAISISQSEFGRRFSIPVRTVQKWECHQANPPEYVERMIERILFLEKRLHELEIKDNGKAGEEKDI